MLWPDALDRGLFSASGTTSIGCWVFSIAQDLGTLQEAGLLLAAATAGRLRRPAATAELVCVASRLATPSMQVRTSRLRRP